MPPASTTSHTQTNSQQHDSTYHLIKDSIVVYVYDTIAPPLKEGMGRSRFRTEYRDRIIIRTDTIYQDKEVIIHAPPEKYVPKTIKWLAYIGVAAIVAFLLWLLWKIRG